MKPPPQSSTSQSSTTTCTTSSNNTNKTNNSFKLFLSYIQVETYTTVLSFRTNADTIFGQRTVSFPYPALRAIRSSTTSNNSNTHSSSNTTKNDNNEEESTEETVGFILSKSTKATATTTTPTPPKTTKRAVSKCNMFVVFLSKSYLSRRSTLYELGWAMEFQKKVVVIDCRSLEERGGGGEDVPSSLVLPSSWSEEEEEEENEEEEKTVGNDPTYSTSKPTLEPPSLSSVTTVSKKKKRILAPCEFRWIYHPKNRLRYTKKRMIRKEETEMEEGEQEEEEEVVGEEEGEGEYGGMLPPQLPTNTTVYTLVFQALKTYDTLVRNHGTDWYFVGDGVIVEEDGEYSKIGKNGTKDLDHGDQEEMENGYRMLRTIGKTLLGGGWITRVCDGWNTIPYVLVYVGVAAVGGLVLVVYFLFFRKG